MTKEDDQPDPDDWFKQQNDFCFGVGRFVLEWPTLEWTLMLLIAEYGEMPQPVAKALLSGARAPVMGAHLMSIGINKGLENTDRFVHLEYLMKQLRALNDVRNELCHSIEVNFSGTAGKRGKLLTDAIRASRADKGKYVRYTVETLANVFFDIRRLHSLLMHHKQTAKEAEFQPPKEDPQYAAWRFTPNEPEKTSQQFRQQTK